MEHLQSILLDLLRFSKNENGKKYNISQSCDFEKLYETIQRHRVDLAFDEYVAFPKNIHRAMNLKRQSNRIDYGLMINALAPVFQKLEEQNISYALCKGISTALCAYQNIGDRYFHDVDLLINISDVEKVEKVLNEYGFIQGKFNRENNCIIPNKRIDNLFFITYTHQLANFLKLLPNTKMKYMVVDVNYQLMWGEAKDRYEEISVKEFLLNTVDAQYGGTRFKILSKEYAFIHSALHLYNDLNSLTILCNKKSHFLQGYMDIYNLIRSMDINWGEVERYCDENRIKKYIYYVLRYTGIVFDDCKLDRLISKPDDYDDIFENSFGLAEDEIKQWKHDIWERIFCEDKKELLRNYLSDKDWQKIEYNYRFLD